MASGSIINKMKLHNEFFTCSVDICDFVEISSLMEDEEQITCGPYYSPNNKLTVEFHVYSNQNTEGDDETYIYLAAKAVAMKKKAKPINMWLTIKSITTENCQIMDNTTFRITDETTTTGPHYLIAVRNSNDSPTLQFTINMQVFWLDDETNNNFQNEMTANNATSTPKPEVARNFKSLFNSDKFSDVKIQVGDKTFPAHKNILWLNCPYFMEMFNTVKEAQPMEQPVEPGNQPAEQPAPENEPKEHPATTAAPPPINTITIDGLTPEIFEEALYFIYTRECPAVHQMSSELLTAASILKMDDLKILCEEKISKNLSVDNVCDFLVLSKTLQAEKLHEDCIAFINEHLDEVRAVGRWSSMRNDHPQFGLEVLEYKVFGELSKI